MDMKDCLPIVQEQLSSLDKNTIDLLRRGDQLSALIRRLFMEVTTQELTASPELLQQAVRTHCQKEKLNNEEALESWLNERCISQDELLLQLSLPIKLNKLAMDTFSGKAEARFLQRKEELDQATYSLLRVKDSGLAHELYLQLEAGEANFQHVASQFSEGPEQRSGGQVGPAPLARAHPKLHQRLRTATPGIVLEPIAIETWWVVARLDERMEASFDDSMHQRMAGELLEQWLQTETNHLLKAVCTSRNSQGQT